MALKTDAKFEGKLTCAFKRDMMNIANFHRLKNSDFILECLRFKKDGLAFGFEANPIQVVISLSLWIKLTMGQLFLFFLCTFCIFFTYVEGVLVTTFFHCY